MAGHNEKKELRCTRFGHDLLWWVKFTDGAKLSLSGGIASNDGINSHSTTRSCLFPRLFDLFGSPRVPGVLLASIHKKAMALVVLQVRLYPSHLRVMDSASEPTTLCA